jgi:peroxisomal enoyl-CoA hydratase 2
MIYVSDYNPLHIGNIYICMRIFLYYIYIYSIILTFLKIDPTIAPKLGFERPILHGLNTYGIAAHAIVKQLANNKPELLKSISARFTAPVYPGDTLETYMWKVPGEKPDETNVIFITKAKERDVIVLGNCLAVLKNGKSNAKL